MKVVFVHGVATRREGHEHEFDSSVAKRTALFRQLSFPSTQESDYFNPYWGRFGGNDAYQGSYVPRATGTETFGAGAAAGKALFAFDPASGSGGTGTQLLRTAMRDQVQAADDIAIAADRTIYDPREFSELAAALHDYAVAEKWEWLFLVRNDTEFQNRLVSELDVFLKSRAGTSEEAFGWRDLLDGVRSGINGVWGSVINAASDKAMLEFKGRLTTSAVGFLGDTCRYLAERPDTPTSQNAITSEVVASLRSAWDDRRAGEKLVVVAHSFGGPVMFDVLSTYVQAGALPEGFKVDAFVTVGSQVAFFQTMDLYVKDIAAYAPVAPPQKLPVPSTVDYWLNVFDLADPLGFKASPVFAGADDYQFDTGASLVTAHSSYFSRPSFYSRLGQRLKDRGIV
ncbi:MAG: hypothetical protein JST30_07555 [Armatimonadetes bacterium]|nr:hypothetical protein [Armatimonadota bacterium]